MSVQTTRASADRDVHDIVADALESVEIGPITSHRNISIAPLSLPRKPQTIYTGWQDAYFSGSIGVREVDATGAVEELFVTNQAATNVLLLDGEELCGLKQNRVLATTVLMPAKASLNIPVSCSEAGRWSPLGRGTMAAGALMARSSRVEKMKATVRNAQATGPRARRYQVDQEQVWANIRDLQTQLGVTSPTEALRDIYVAKKEAITQYLDALRGALVGQGVVVWLNGRLVGVELVSISKAYNAIREQLLQSYIIDALRMHQGLAFPVHPETANRFIERCNQGQGDAMESVGLGVDIRYAGSAGVLGSCLVHKSEVIHASLFPGT